MTTPEPYWQDEEAGLQLHLGESLDVLPTLPDASVDAIVCDPPYALTDFPTQTVTDALTAWLTDDRAYTPATGAGFMQRSWDRFVPPPAIWDECLRVLKPGGHLLAFAGARTVDLMGLSIRLAGLQIRDSIDWVFGSGMPKGTHQLKPAHEPIIVARKPPVGSLTATILAHGTGALNIDATRTVARQDYRNKDAYGESTGVRKDSAHAAGRWPTNLLLTHPPLLDDGLPVGDACADGCVPGCPVAEMDAQSGVLRARGNRAPTIAQKGTTGVYGEYSGAMLDHGPGDSGGASRFFPVSRYEAKAPAVERPRLADGTAWPTVKPLALMRWLVRLVTPPGGLVLDWCAGTGTTLEAARLEGFPAIGIEREPAGAALCRVRLDKPYMTSLFGDTA